MATTSRQTPLWFRIAAVVLLIWSVVGCYACLQQFRLGADAMGPASDYDRALYASLPVWYNAIYAVAVGTGLLGAVALLTRSVLAVPLYAISLVAVVVQFGWLFATTDIVAVRGAAQVVPFPILIVAIGAGALWLSRHARRRGWIG
ncbi:hypothetical protein ACT009_04010 [Sphingomonas sp. Tas61C01]|uniref:hypothetical protein n=1 Tax=Sphingomonas sp. Tas61C01 TaxID=3458297 RepID=UPI00403EB761